MIRVNQLKLPINHNEEDLLSKLCQTLRVNRNEVKKFEIIKRSIDARKKPELYYVYAIHVTVDNEAQVLKKDKKHLLQAVQEKKYQFPVIGKEKLAHAPVIIGAGPAGLFAAYLLSEMGYCPVLFERGKAVEERKQDVLKFWETGILDVKSNVQFGEGGAGAFSDGKLNTAVKDPSGRNRHVLETFVKYGAPEQILYDAKPHIGTDILETVLVQMRRDLESKGCQFYFEHFVSDFNIKDGKLSSIRVNEKELPVEVLILAPGHSARDTFETLFDKKIAMEAKQFAVGFRVEHPQEMINNAQYGEGYPLELPAAPYKVTSNFPNGRGVYSFCMCPGGYVVNSSSEEGRTVVNGMSYSARDGKNANSAIIVSVGPEDFGNEPLDGVKFQRELESKCYRLADGKIPQQLYGDFCENKVSQSFGAFTTDTKGETAFANLRGLLLPEMEQSFMDGMTHFNKIIPGFNREDAILSGLESRTSSPLRIVRDDLFESSVRGIYPCGEGAGYAGGIMSAAMDGLKVAEAIIERYSKAEE